MSDQGIEGLKITPEAEHTTQSPPTVSGPQEVEFFNRGAEEYRLRHNQLNLGWLGKVFGQGSAASTNIAGLTVVISLILVLVATGSDSPEIKNLADKGIALITLALGYLFGAHQSKNKDNN